MRLCINCVYACQVGKCGFDDSFFLLPLFYCPCVLFLVWLRLPQETGTLHYCACDLFYLCISLCRIAGVQDCKSTVQYAGVFNDPHLSPPCHSFYEFVCLQKQTNRKIWGLVPSSCFLTLPPAGDFIFVQTLPLFLLSNPEFTCSNNCLNQITNHLSWPLWHTLKYAGKYTHSTPVWTKVICQT